MEPKRISPSGDRFGTKAGSERIVNT